MGTEMTGADIVVQALTDLGVEVVFGYPGGAVLPIYDALFQQNRIRHILVRHEQAAVHAAEGYARSSGKVGVVLVTSGPGATNAVTGITDALMDSIPLVVLTGQVPTHLIGTDAFQECDTVGITRHCSKHNYLVQETARLGPVLHEAFYIARSGRPGRTTTGIGADARTPMNTPTAVADPCPATAETSATGVQSAQCSPHGLWTKESNQSTNSIVHNNHDNSHCANPAKEHAV